MKEIDLKQLAEKISHHQMIFLGESAHGIKEQNIWRIELIKILHESYGYHHVFIESIKSNESYGQQSLLSAQEFIKNCLHEVYHTQEILDLVSYANEAGITFEGFEIEGDNLKEYRNIKIHDDFGSRSFRDKTMFTNFQKLVNGRLKNKKVIVWGHNHHLMKKTTKGAFREKVFGEFVFESFKSSLYTLGQFTGQGQIEHMPGQERNLLPRDGYVEKYIVDNVKNISIYEKLELPIFKKTVKHMICGGEDTEELILSNHLDGVVFHKNGNSPIRI